MAEAVKVVVRCRPMNRREMDLTCQCILSMDSSRGQCSIVNPNEPKAPPKHFFFDGSYYTDSTTEQIYADIGYPLVEGVTEGYNGTIFAYGQTGCGKSFTMQGVSDPPTQRGIIPRAFEHIFETIAISEQSRYLVHASYLEIYNEDIRDLLGKDVKAKLELKEHPEKGVYVAGLSMHKVTNVRECQVIMDRGWKNRSTGATLMNQDSSRSHSIFCINLERTDAQDDGDDEQHIRAGKLNLVDLAGSERQSKSGATGERLKEATKINLSLSALGNVISALVDGKSKHIPYRDSRLTRLLQDSLGGNTKTLMVACLSPADNNFDETLSTLRYANRAKNIQNKPKINEDPKDALLREYQQEIERLKQMLMSQGGFSALQPPPQQHMQMHPIVTVNTMEMRSRDVDPAEIERQKRHLEEEKERIRREYEERLLEKENMYKSEAADKARLMEEMKKLRHYYDSKMEKLDECYRSFPSPGENLNEVPRHRKGELNALQWHEPCAPTNLSDGVAGSVLIVGAQGETLPVTATAPPIDDGYFEGDHNRPPPYSEFSPGDAVHASLNKPGRQAKHIRSHSSTKTDTSANLPGDGLSKEELLKKLQQLEASMVGGEQSQNKDLKERHRRRTRHVQKRMQQFREATKDMDGEEIIADIFGNIQEEVRYKNKLLSKEKDKVEALEQEIEDLHAEFERDRTDYLDTIREQEKRLKLYQSILEKMVAGVRKDSNYTNIDRIISMSKWNIDKEEWTVPPLTIEKVHLPPTGDEQVASQRTSYKQRNPRGEEDYGHADNCYGNTEDDRLYQKLAARENAAMDYFSNKRANKLLQGRPQMDEVQSQDSYGYGGRYGGADEYVGGDMRGMNPARRYLESPYYQEENYPSGISHSYSTPDEMNMAKKLGNRLGGLETSAASRSAIGSRRANRHKSGRNDYS